MVSVKDTKKCPVNVLALVFSTEKKERNTSTFLKRLQVSNRPAGGSFAKMLEEFTSYNVACKRVVQHNSFKRSSFFRHFFTSRHNY